MKDCREQTNATRSKRCVESPPAFWAWLAGKILHLHHSIESRSGSLRGHSAPRRVRTVLRRQPGPKGIQSTRAGKRLSGTCILDPRVCNIMAFWAIVTDFGPLFYLLLGVQDGSLSSSGQARAHHAEQRIRTPSAPPKNLYISSMHPKDGSLDRSSSRPLPIKQGAGLLQLI